MRRYKSNQYAYSTNNPSAIVSIIGDDTHEDIFENYNKSLEECP